MKVSFALRVSFPTDICTLREQTTKTFIDHPFRESNSFDKLLKTANIEAASTTAMSSSVTARTGWSKINGQRVGKEDRSYHQKNRGRP